MGKDMDDVIQCVVCDGEEYERIKVGGEGDCQEGEADAVCGDCGKRYGEYHVDGCDCECCPICGGQLLSCDCDLD